jgi:hypothetical protein
MKVIGVLFLAGTVLGGCAYGGTFKFSGPSNATFSDFAQKRYECYSNLRGESASGSINKHGGTYVKHQSVSCGAMDACMAGSGYRRSKNGRFDASSIKVRCN